MAYEEVRESYLYLVEVVSSLLGRKFHPIFASYIAPLAKKVASQSH